MFPAESCAYQSSVISTGVPFSLTVSRITLATTPLAIFAATTASWARCGTRASRRSSPTTRPPARRRAAPRSASSPAPSDRPRGSPRSRRRASPSSSPLVSIGGCTTTSMVAGRTMMPCLGSASSVLRKHDRHDRHARRHRHVEGALLEAAEAAASGCACPRARSPARGPADRLDHRLQRLDAFVVVGAVDEHGAGGGEDRPEDRVAPHLLLGDADDVAPRAAGRAPACRSPLWWLKMKTAGRCDQRCSSPVTRDVDAGERGAELAPGG